MQVIRDLRNYDADRPLALAIGNFDGLHRGHAAVLARTRAIAQEAGLLPAVLTFAPHPRRFFSPAAPAFRLQTLRDKLDGLGAAGMARVFALRFDAAFAALGPQQFLEGVLQQAMQSRAVVTGQNFSFGCQRAGDIAQLRGWGAAQGIRTEQVPPVIAEGDVCSSTAVRAALEVGDMRHAAALLGRPYRLGGRVAHGQKQGARLGYPTANIAPAPGLKLPRLGVYAVEAVLGGQRYPAVASLGVRPALNPLPAPLLEVHLFDFDGDLYGRRCAVDFHAHLRDEKSFDSREALAHQIGADARQARALLENRP